jgi:uncharacterized protein with GYD domain
MPIYVALANFTDQGIKNFRGTERYGISVSSVKPAVEARSAYVSILSCVLHYGKLEPSLR